MMNETKIKIKKAYQGIYDYLASNQDQVVADLMPTIESLLGPKSGGGRASGSSSNARYDEDGNLTHIFCYYHKLWEPVALVEYGKKASSSTGLNSMCKEGLGQWTKQQQQAKKAKVELLNQVAAGVILPTDIEAAQCHIEEARTAVSPRADGIGEAE